MIGFSIVVSGTRSRISTKPAMRIKRRGEPNQTPPGIRRRLPPEIKPHTQPIAATTWSSLGNAPVDFFE
jgi:hypothetical protein